MNRKERRHMQKQLGLNDFYKKETRQQKFSRWEENQENGRRMMEDKKEEIRISQQEQEDNKASESIITGAEKIASQKQIPLIDAMVEAQEKINKNTNS